MKTLQHLIAATLVAITGGSAFAQEATPDHWMSASSSKSRAQIQAELVAARKDGSIKAGGSSYDFAGRAASTKPRAQVRAEAEAARASGELAAINGEAHGFDVPRTPVYANAR